MFTVSEAIHEFRQVVLGSDLDSVNFSAPASELELEALTCALDEYVPTDLREFWEISGSGYWTIPAELGGPVSAIVHSYIYNRQVLNDGAIPIKKVIHFGGDSICYVLDGPKRGQIVYIDVQNPEDWIPLGDSLNEYLNTVVALAQAGQVRLATYLTGTKHERRVPEWVGDEGGGPLEVPDKFQKSLNIGPLFY